MYCHQININCCSVEFVWLSFSSVHFYMKVLVAQSCRTLCDPMDYSPPGSSVHGILQARILGRVAFPFSRGSFQPRDRTQVSHIAGRFFTIWAKYIASKWFSKEYIMTLLWGKKALLCLIKQFISFILFILICIYLFICSLFVGLFSWFQHSSVINNILLQREVKVTWRLVGKFLSPASS